jgi:hypothetical protein
MTQAKIADQFRVVTTRPLNALKSVGIAELAQFTFFPTGGVFPVADADITVRNEWRFEVDEGHGLERLTFKDACIVFKDGSTLTFKTKSK